MGAREIQNGFDERGEKKLRRFFATGNQPPRRIRRSPGFGPRDLYYAKIWMARENYSGSGERIRARAGSRPRLRRRGVEPRVRAQSRGRAGARGARRRRPARIEPTRGRSPSIARSRSLFSAVARKRGPNSSASRARRRANSTHHAAPRRSFELGTAEERRTLEAYRTLGEANRGRSLDEKWADD